MTQQCHAVVNIRAPHHVLMLCLVGRLIDEMRSGVEIETHPSELDNKQITRLHQLLHEAKFKEPDGSHLSPAGLPHHLPEHTIYLS